MAVACFAAADEVLVGFEFVFAGWDLFSSLGAVVSSLAGMASLFASGAEGDGGVWVVSDVGAAESLPGAEVVAALLKGVWGSGVITGVVRWVETK